MHFQDSYSYPASLTQVLKMYHDPEFTKDRMEPGHLLDEKVTASGTDENFSVTASAKVDSAQLPDKARRFIPGQLSFTMEESWERLSETEARGTLVVKVAGAPVSFTSTSKLTQNGGETTRTIEGDLKISIPFLGGKLEKEAARFIPQVIGAEQAAAAKWLKENQ